MTTVPPQDLLDPNDPDWLKFQAQDPDWFLKVAGDTIRQYCGWHIWPNIHVHELQLAIGARGIIMLPSRYVTHVESVNIFPKTNDPQTLNPATDYFWSEEGWIQRTGFPQGDTAGYYFGPDPGHYPIWQSGLVTVTFNHGYELVPAPVKEVAYELTLSTTEMRAGNVKSISTPGFRLQPGADFGANLSDNQKNRLANYRVSAVI